MQQAFCVKKKTDQFALQNAVADLVMKAPSDSEKQITEELCLKL